MIIIIFFSGYKEMKPPPPKKKSLPPPLVCANNRGKILSQFKMCGVWLVHKVLNYPICSSQNTWSTKLSLIPFLLSRLIRLFQLINMCKPDFLAKLFEEMKWKESHWKLKNAKLFLLKWEDFINYMATFHIKNS